MSDGDMRGRFAAGCLHRGGCGIGAGDVDFVGGNAPMVDVIANAGPEAVSTTRCFGGTQHVFRHRSEITGTDMRFAAFVPPQGVAGKLPVVWFLAGLTCTEENFTVKAGAQRVAAGLGLILIAPDT